MAEQAQGLRIKDWHRFQHFKDRRPPWVKLYRDILDDMDWHELDPAAAKALVMLWLIASEDGGNLPEVKKLAFRLRVSEADCNSLILQLSHWLERGDNAAISERYQSDAPEGETEGETETEARASKGSKRKGETTLPDWLATIDGDAIPADDSILNWADSVGLPRDWIALAWWAFEARYESDPKTYRDWRAVFRRAVREDWLRIWRKGRTGWELTTAGEQVRQEMGA